MRKKGFKEGDRVNYIYDTFAKKKGEEKYKVADGYVANKCKDDFGFNEYTVVDKKEDVERWANVPHEYVTVGMAFETYFDAQSEANKMNEKWNNEYDEWHKYE